MEGINIVLSSKRHCLKRNIRQSIYSYIQLIFLAIAGYMMFMDAPPTILFIIGATLILLIILLIAIQLDVNYFAFRIAKIELKNNKIFITTLDIDNRARKVFEFLIEDIDVVKKGTIIRVITKDFLFGLEEHFSFYKINETVDFFQRNNIKVIDENKL